MSTNGTAKVANAGSIDMVVNPSVELPFCLSHIECSISALQQIDNALSVAVSIVPFFASREIHYRSSV